jgi:hypothetical protein
VRERHNPRRDDPQGVKETLAGKLDGELRRIAAAGAGKALGNYRLERLAESAKGTEFEDLLRLLLESGDAGDFLRLARLVGERLRLSATTEPERAPKLAPLRYADIGEYVSAEGVRARADDFEYLAGLFARLYDANLQREDILYAECLLIPAIAAHGTRRALEALDGLLDRCLQPGLTAALALELETADVFYEKYKDRDIREVLHRKLLCGETAPDSLDGRWRALYAERGDELMVLLTSGKGVVAVE